MQNNSFLVAFNKSQRLTYHDLNIDENENVSCIGIYEDCIFTAVFIQGKRVLFPITELEKKVFSKFTRQELYLISSEFFDSALIIEKDYRKQNTPFCITPAVVDNIKFTLSFHTGPNFPPYARIYDMYPNNGLTDIILQVKSANDGALWENFQTLSTSLFYNDSVHQLFEINPIELPFYTGFLRVVDLELNPICIDLPVEVYTAPRP